MGCDIHVWAEIRTDGRWEKVGAVFDDPGYCATEPDSDWNQPKTDQPYSGRNYDLFAILANVRNGYGFAGCDTGDGFVPIAEPRGLPGDVSEGVKAKSDYWDSDGHSHSHLTLAEIRAFDWDRRKTVHRGWVEPDEFKKWRETGKPEEWCGGVSGPAVEHVSIPEMEALIRTGDLVPGISYYTQVSWGESYAASAGERWPKTVEALGSLGSPEDVRIVFFFDN